MTNQVDTQKYTEFVDAVTSQESKDYITFNSINIFNRPNYMI